MATFLFVVPRFHTNLWFAVRALVEAGHRVEMAVRRIAASEDHGWVAPIEIGPDPDAAAVRRLMGDVAPDLVLVRGADRLIREVGVAARRAGARVLRYDQRPMTRVTPMGRRLGNLLRRRPSHRVTPLPGLDPAARRDPVAVYVPFPVAALRHDPPTRSEAGPVRVLCVGKLAQPRKNQMLLVDALRSLAAPDLPVRLTLVGSSTMAARGAHEDHHAAQVEAARIESWIEMRSDVPFAGMGAVYAAHDICVLPSVGEPLGSAPIEGMAYGTIPVISTGAGSAGLVVDGVTGLRVDVTRPGALADALRPLLARPDLRARFSVAARRQAETEFSPARYVARMEALLAR